MCKDNHEYEYISHEEVMRISELLLEQHREKPS